MSKVCIIGAGITGLATAWQLKQAGNDCTVLENSDRVGGAIQTIRRDGYLAEEGPNSIQLNSVEIENFIQSIPSLYDELIEAAPAANKRFIVRNGEAHSVPMGPLSAITNPLWSLGGKLRVLKEPFIAANKADAEESVADFARRRLGNELYQYAINPLVGGIYAGDPEKLSLRYAFPRLYALEREHGGLIRGAVAKMKAAKNAPGPKFRKRIISFKEGLDTLPRKIAEALGHCVHTDSHITSIKRDNRWRVVWNDQACEFDQLIVTSPAHSIMRLPFQEDLREDLSSFAESIDYPPVSVLSLGYNRDQVTHPLDGFGALVPECEQRKILGVLFPSSVFSDRAPDGEVLLTIFVGGERSPEIATDQTEALMEAVRPELQSLLGVNGDPTFVHHKHWSQAIPQYKLGYGEKLAAMNTIEHRHPGLKLAGNYRTGISLTYCLEAALKA